jgi:CoA:oxalate CoA-transferase
MARALEGIRVIDLTHVLAGPIATMLLADLGAEVIHVEPPHGDDAREFGPFAGQPGKDRSAYFISLNRNKKSIVLNLKHEEGKQVLRRLIKISDVIIENYRPTTLPEMGFDWSEIQKINPAIIYASISGFGHDTPPEYRSRPAYDIIAQAYSGFMSITGPEDGAPCRAGASIGDIFAGHQAAIGILAALMHRGRTGRGQRYDGSMVDGLFFVLENAVVQHTVGHHIPGPIGSTHPSIAPFQAAPTRDGWLVIAIGNDSIWKRFCKAIGRSDLSARPEFGTNSLRSKNRKALMEIVEKEMAKRTTRAWSRILDRESIPHSPINNMKQVCDDACIQHRNMLVEMEQPQIGRVKVVGSPIHLSETPGEVFAPAPLLGEHTGEILKNLLEYSDEDIARLRADGVINQG